MICQTMTTEVIIDVKETSMFAKCKIFVMSPITIKELAFCIDIYVCTVSKVIGIKEKIKYACQMKNT